MSKSVRIALYEVDQYTDASLLAVHNSSRELLLARGWFINSMHITCKRGKNCEGDVFIAYFCQQAFCPLSSFKHSLY